MSNVFITGSSSGFGLLTTRTLLSKGHTVFATMRDPTGRNAQKADEISRHGSDTDGKVYVIPLDVTKDDSVRKAVGEAMEHDGTIDVVVNNAGAGTAGFTECFSAEAMHSLFDLNVYGPQRVNREALIHMRDRGEGLLIHVSSTLGRMVFPYCGVYTASKYALEGLAESYRYELAPLGIDSIIVEPGGYATNFFASMRGPDDEARMSSFGDGRKAPEQFWNNLGGMLSSSEAPSPQLVADAIHTLIETPLGERPLRTVVDPNFGQGPAAINMATDALQNQVFGALGIGEMLGPKK